MRLTREAMWDRMMASDATFNGRFYTGVHSTGIYCLPSCHARKPKPENVSFYRTATKAEEAGLRPCKKCRPDEFARGIDTEEDRLAAVLAEVDADPARFKCVEDLAYAAAVSPSTLFSAVRTHFHVSPAALLTVARIRKASTLLRTESAGAAEIGLSVGFDSTSAFYENFRRFAGMPPAQYRRLGTSADFEIDLPEGYRPESVLKLLARDQESRTERVEGNRFALSLWAGSIPVVIEGRFAGRTLQICRDARGDAFSIHRQLIRLLGLAQDPAPFEEHVRELGHGALVEGSEGLRIPQSPTHFDGLVWSIVGQQVNLAFAGALRRRLAEIAGVPIDGVMYAPPTPAGVAKLTVDELVPHQFSRRKAEYLIGAAQAIVSGALDFGQLEKMAPARAERVLLAVRGLGPWSAHYLMMRSLGCWDCVPLGDTGLTTALARFFGVARPGPTETLALMAQFRPYRSLATYHLWRGQTQCIPN